MINMIGSNVSDAVCRCPIKQADAGEKRREGQALPSLNAFAEWLATYSMNQEIGDRAASVMSQAMPYSVLNTRYPLSYGFQNALASSLMNAAGGGNHSLTSPLLLSSLMRYPKLSIYAMQAPLGMSGLLGYSNFNRYF